MPQAISNPSVTSFATELAELLVQSEAVESDSDRLQRSAARASFLENAQHQVDSLRAAAKATETGALISGGLSALGGLCEVGGAVFKYKAEMDSAGLCPGTVNADLSRKVAGEMRDANILHAVGNGLSGLAAPTKSLVGDATAMRDDADAKRFETLGEEARWQASDRSTAIDKRGELGDKLLDLVQDLEQAQSASANAVIGRI